MLRILSFVLAVSLFINIILFAKWRELRRPLRFTGADGAAEFGSNPYGLKIIEPVAVTQSIGSLRSEWLDAAVKRQALKSLVDKDFPEESPILI